MRLLAALVGGTVLYGVAIAPRRVVVSQHEVTLAGLPPEMDGLRIVQLSDLHVGPLFRAGSVRSVVRLANSLQPDIVVLTGDFVSYRSMKYLPNAARELAGLRAPKGIFASLGNHDYWERAEGVRAALAACGGLRLLTNENVRIGPGLYLAALDDLMSGHPDLGRALRGIPADSGLILISHNPTVLPKVANRACFVIAGHTHGGQVALPFLGPRGTSRIPGVGSFEYFYEWAGVRRHHGRREAISTYRYPSGWYHEGRARMYVSRGIGCGLAVPLRLNCRPEVASFTLRRPR